MKKEEIETYRKKQISDIELPSGLIVKVKNISPYVMLKVQEEMGIPAGELDNISALFIEKLFEKFLISPKIPDEFGIDDFYKEDYEKLQEIALKHIIYSEEKSESKQKK